MKINLNADNVWSLHCDIARTVCLSAEGGWYVPLPPKGTGPEEHLLPSIKGRKTAGGEATRRDEGAWAAVREHLVRVYNRAAYSRSLCSGERAVRRFSRFF
jgi:hypothetical protein